MLEGGKLWKLLVKSGVVDKTNMPWHLGRLDKTTTGLLLFTNSGLLTDLYMCKGHLAKVYRARVDRSGKAMDENEIITKVKSDGRTIPNSLALETKEFKDDERAPGGGRWFYTFRISISTGENRIVHKLFSAAGVNIQHLERSAISSLNLNQLVPDPGTFIECGDDTKAKLVEDLGGWQAFTDWRICTLRCICRRKDDARLREYLQSHGVDISGDDLCFDRFPMHTCECQRDRSKKRKLDPDHVACTSINER